MAVDVRRYEGDPARYVEAVFVAFGEHVGEPEREPFERLLEGDRMIAACDGNELVGTAAAISFELSVPGAVVPAAGVTVVGVHPTHRRQGILRRMMLSQLADVRDRGEPVAVLWASDAGIYQRFGYGLASLKAGIRIDRHVNAYRAPHEPGGRLRMVSAAEARAAFPPIYDAARPNRPGFFSRVPAYWDAWTFNFPAAWREGRGEPFHVLHETDGSADGYVRYAIRSGDQTELSVLELIATTPAAQLDLWRFLLDVDLMDRVENWNLAVDDPLLLAVDQPRKLSMKLGDALWLRIVDVRAALEGRRYRGSGRLVLDVRDEVLPANARRWAVEVDEGTASVAPTDAAADLAIDVTDLGAAYLGGVSWRQLAGALRVREMRPGAAEDGDALFASSRAPWAPGVF